MTTQLNLLTRHWSQRWHAVQALQRRNSQSTGYSVGLYLTTTVAFVGAAVALHNTLRFVELNAVLATRQPLFLPIFVTAVLTSIYLALMSSISASRERDQGTLEVLLYGPVDEAAFILGKFLAQLKIYLGVLVMAFVWTNLTTWVLHLAFSVEALVLIATSLVPAAAVIAFGLLTALWGGRTRNAVIYFILIVLLLVSLQTADSTLSAFTLATSPTQNDPLLLVRNALVVINGVVQWISPYAQFGQAMDDLLSGSLASYLLRLGLIGLQTLVFLAGSLLILQRKGPRG